MTRPSAEIERPLRVGELVAAAIRIFGSRPLEFVALGVLLAGAYLGATAVPFVAGVAILAAAFTFSLGLVVRLVAGDSVSEGLERMARAGPCLVVLGIVVAVPFYIGSAWLVLLLLSIPWLGLTAFAIPAAVVEEAEGGAITARIAHALRRTVALARVQYVHALGVVATLLIIDLLVGAALALALFEFADNGRYAAVALAQIVLGPFFFIGLTVLYFEQRARAGMVARPADGFR